MSEYKADDVKYSEDAYCEHCYELEPFTPVVEDGAYYCLDCIGRDEFSKEDLKRIEVHATKLRILYYENRLNGLRIYLDTLEKSL